MKIPFSHFTTLSFQYIIGFIGCFHTFLSVCSYLMLMSTSGQGGYYFHYTTILEDVCSDSRCLNPVIESSQHLL